jgi:hypothetical protein
MLSEEQRKKISQRMMGHIVSQETRDKISKTKTGNVHLSQESIEKMLLTRKKLIDEGRWHGGKKGWHHTKESRQRLSNKAREQWADPVRRTKILKSLEGKRRGGVSFGERLPPEWCESIRQARLNEWADPKQRKKRIKACHTPSCKEKKRRKTKASWQNPLIRESRAKGIVRSWHDPEIREKRIESIKKSWEGEEVRSARIKAMRGCLDLRPNKPEQTVLDILEANFPLEWKYTGDGSIIIDGLNPDFVNVNGKKQIIEVFGDYWHSEKKVRKLHQTEKGRKEAFSVYGYDTLIIWERELKDPDKVLAKITEFVNEE